MHAALTMKSLDAREFRNALSHFATGVVIATANCHGQLLGTTISSFNSVSLLPPLVLFSIARSALGLDLWRTADSYGVTVWPNTRPISLVDLHDLALINLLTCISGRWTTVRRYSLIGSHISSASPMLAMTVAITRYSWGT